jgi:hypothetical protein
MVSDSIEFNQRVWVERGLRPADHFEVFFRTIEPRKPFGQQGYDKPYTKAFSGDYNAWKEWLEWAANEEVTQTPPGTNSRL